MLQNNAIAWEIVSSFRGKNNLLFSWQNNRVHSLHHFTQTWFTLTSLPRLPAPPQLHRTPSTSMSHVFLTAFSPLSGVTFQTPHLQNLLVCGLGDWIVSLKVFSSSNHFSDNFIISVLSCMCDTF